MSALVPFVIKAYVNSDRITCVSCGKRAAPFVAGYRVPFPGQAGREEVSITLPDGWSEEHVQKWKSHATYHQSWLFCPTCTEARDRTMGRST